jgi:hypothetical protein
MGPDFGKMYILHFETESTASVQDELIVDGTTFSGKDAPMQVESKDFIVWGSSERNPRKGWKICPATIGIKMPITHAENLYTFFSNLEQYKCHFLASCPTYGGWGYYDECPRSQYCGIGMPLFKQGMQVAVAAMTGVANVSGPLISPVRVTIRWDPSTMDGWMEAWITMPAGVDGPSVEAILEDNMADLQSVATDELDRVCAENPIFCTTGTTQEQLEVYGPIDPSKIKKLVFGMPELINAGSCDCKWEEINRKVIATPPLGTAARD